MTTVSASEARAKLYRLIDEAASSHEAIVITGKRSSAVLISIDDWRVVQPSVPSPFYQPGMQPGTDLHDSSALLRANGKCSAVPKRGWHQGEFLRNPYLKGRDLVRSL